ncbi:hypothetical protein BDN72DRAFT_827611 [Pluteus cervinus]|uniref:Uncharacterized protein n=1 Tax=Pluteus cervinus TaxID=181527 RepID=A0ACD3A8V3_9AGAR|nr:hypothetical protein BDN72DRAFT_827611 [Pluteus cervinus]
MSKSNPTSSVPEPHALFPLTLLDISPAGIGVNFTWLVRGRLDTELIQASIGRVTNKWRLLAGRVEFAKNEFPYPLQLRIPLAPELDESKYKTFAFTETTSTVPLTQYVPLPIPTIHPALPHHLTCHQHTPKSAQEWIKRSLPLLWWHVTHFPSSLGGVGIKDDYTCIGISFPHGVFDGMGCVLILRALQAEMYQRDWDVPPPLQEGLNANPLLEIIEARTKELESGSEKGDGLNSMPYAFFENGGIWQVIRFVWRQFWQERWYGATKKTLVLPACTVKDLVDEVKEELQNEGITTRITTGDVIAAWLYKACYLPSIYSDGTPGHSSTFLSNIGQLRAIIAPNDDLKHYLHNCFLPLPYPVLTVTELQATPIYRLVCTLAQARESRTPEESIRAYAFLQDSYSKIKPAAVWYRPPGVDEEFILSNMTVFKLEEVDWGMVGGKETICIYRSLLSPAPIDFSDQGTVNGWIQGPSGSGDGKLVIELFLNRARWERLEGWIANLEKQKQKQ